MPNYGLLDQMAALQWVEEDPSRITLIGQGWVKVHNTSEIAVKLAKELDCSLPADLYTHHTNILDCLREKSVEQLTNVKLDTFAFKAVWGPSYDGITVKNNFVEIKGKRSFESR